MIVRYGPPSKMDYAVYGTLCRVENSSNKVEIYKQMSHDEESPNWVLIEEIDSCKNQYSEESLTVTTIPKKFTDSVGQ